MQIHQNNFYKVFKGCHNRVIEHLKRSGIHISDIDIYTNNRALIICKLDIILTEHRNSVDKNRFVLFGKNALYHYLFTKKGIPLSEAKSMSFHDSLIVLWGDIAACELPRNVDDFLHEHYDLISHESHDIDTPFRYFEESEWDPSFADEIFR
ncbi:ECs1072 family phage-associated protein [Lonsdalea britannica]|uniref:ECs1072 family phage-associated protein n=1 Tax=Lonsdalea britannica TaxID=1082704 RepID=UPI000BFEB04E|nr:hypothetical protein [Lonsdalea britannica]